MLCDTNLTRWAWPLTLKINRVPDSLKDDLCTKFGQNQLQDVDSRVFTRMLYGNNLTWWPWPLTWPWKSIVFQILLRTKYVPSLVKMHWKMLILECSQGCYRRTNRRKEWRKEGRTEGRTVALLYPFATSLARG
jgi:hypothetical protein